MKRLASFYLNQLCSCKSCLPTLILLKIYTVFTLSCVMCITYEWMCKLVKMLVGCIILFDIILHFFLMYYKITSILISSTVIIFIYLSNPLFHWFFPNGIINNLFNFLQQHVLIVFAITSFIYFICYL